MQAEEAPTIVAQTCPNGALRDALAPSGAGETCVHSDVLCDPHAANPSFVQRKFH